MVYTKTCPFQRSQVKSKVAFACYDTRLHIYHMAQNTTRNCWSLADDIYIRYIYIYIVSQWSTISCCVLCHVVNLTNYSSVTHNMSELIYQLWTADPRMSVTFCHPPILACVLTAPPWPNCQNGMALVVWYHTAVTTHLYTDTHMYIYKYKLGIIFLCFTLQCHSLFLLLLFHYLQLIEKSTITSHQFHMTIDGVYLHIYFMTDWW